MSKPQNYYFFAEVLQQATSFKTLKELAISQTFTFHKQDKRNHKLVFIPWSYPEDKTIIGSGNAWANPIIHITPDETASTPYTINAVIWMMEHPSIQLCTPETKWKVLDVYYHQEGYFLDDEPIEPEEAFTLFQKSCLAGLQVFILD